jgi:tRNA U34 5-methylaminomethyl-2-thiouridine-forming methyltransferase MnmC
MDTYKTKVYIDDDYFIDAALIMHMIQHRTYHEAFAEAGVVRPALVTMTFKVEYLDGANNATR